MSEEKPLAKWVYAVVSMIIIIAGTIIAVGIPGTSIQGLFFK